MLPVFDTPGDGPTLETFPYRHAHIVDGWVGDGDPTDPGLAGGIDKGTSPYLTAYLGEVSVVP